MLEMGIPVGAGTDATRVASYNPWISLYWMVTGKTVGGTALYGEENKVDRLEALRLYTLGSAKLSREENSKGSLSTGMYADMAVLSHDYFTVPEDSIKNITSLLTILGGKVVYAAENFQNWIKTKICLLALIGLLSVIMADTTILAPASAIIPKNPLWIASWA